MVDQFTGLTYATAATTRLRLGTGVCLVPEHYAIDLAKRIATLDHYSGGRLILSVGAGWSPGESAAIGGDFPRRWRQTRESVQVMKALWTEDAPEHHGDYYDFPLLHFNPKPSQQPHPPILLGGRSKHVFQRIAAWADRWIPISIGPEEVRSRIGQIERECEKRERDISEVSVTLHGPRPDEELATAVEADGAARVSFCIDSRA